MSIFLCSQGHTNPDRSGVPVDDDIPYIDEVASDSGIIDTSKIIKTIISPETKKNKYLYVNQNDFAVWIGVNRKLHDVYFHNGEETTNITNTRKQVAFYPQVNSNSSITYNDFWGNIFLFDGTSTIELPENGMKYSQKAVLSENGHVAWLGRDFRKYRYKNHYRHNDKRKYNLKSKSKYIRNSIHKYKHKYRHYHKVTDVFLYNGSTTKQLTDSSMLIKNHQINANGHMVWQGFTSNSWEIFYYDGDSVQQITHNDYEDANPQINDQNLVVWSGFDGDDFEIFSFDGFDVTQITDNDLHNREPQVNNNGDIAWVGYTGKIIKKRHCYRWGNDSIRLHIKNSEIYLHKDNNTTQITDTSYIVRHVDIADSGILVWEGYPEKHTRRNAEIYFYDGAESYRLTKNNVPDIGPQIGNQNIYWTQKNGGYGSIYRAALPLLPSVPVYEVPLNSLSLYMPTDTNFNDMSGNHNPITSSPNIDNTVFKLGGGSGRYDGDDRAFIPLTTANGHMDIFNSITDDVTVSFWIKHNSLGGLQSYLVRGGQVFDSTPPNRWGLGHSMANGVCFVLSNVNYNQTIHTTIEEGNITDTDWHHWALVRTQDQFGIYLDGQLIYHTVIEGPMAASTDFRIGYEDLQYYFNGYMDGLIISRSNIFGAAPDENLSDSFMPPSEGFEFTQ